ncbi:MAG TPA: hypothetical protein VEK08_02135 [Planctomycetota bacterium]|nr:hypothetical protein [Planctomycetota bacterium]
MNRPLESREAKPSLITRIGCSVLLAFLLFGFFLPLRQRAFDSQFYCHYSFASAQSGAVIHFATQPGSTTLSVFLMIVAGIFGLLWLTSVRRYSLGRLLIFVLFVGAAGWSGVFLDNARRTVGVFDASFEKQLPTESMSHCKRALTLDFSDESFGARYKNLLTGDELALIRRSELRVETDPENWRVSSMFIFSAPQSITSREQAGRAYMKLFEAVVTDVAIAEGLQPLSEKDRRIKTGYIER